VNRGGGSVVPFVGRRARGQPPTYGASRWLILRDRARVVVGRVLNRCRLPGVIRPIRYEDGVTGDIIEVRVRPLSTRLSVNGRDYYFDRLTGRFVGTGMGCR
jgi:hypothetical protein